MEGWPHITPKPNPRRPSIRWATLGQDVKFKKTLEDSSQKDAFHLYMIRGPPSPPTSQTLYPPGFASGQPWSRKGPLPLFGCDPLAENTVIAATVA